MAIDKKLAKPVEAELELPQGASLVSGEREVELGHLAGRSALTGNRWKSPAFFQGLPSDYASRTVWIVRGEGPIEVEVRGGGPARRGSKQGSISTLHACQHARLCGLLSAFRSIRPSIGTTNRQHRWSVLASGEVLADC